MFPENETPVSDLEPKHLEAIEALLTHRTFTAAAEACGVDRKTIFNYLKHEPFRLAYEGAKHARLQEATQLAAAGISEALECLRLEMTEAPAAKDRIRAAEAFAKLSDHLIDSLTVRESLARLEAEEGILDRLVDRGILSRTPQGFQLRKG